MVRLSKNRFSPTSQKQIHMITLCQWLSSKAYRKAIKQTRTIYTNDSCTSWIRTWNMDPKSHFSDSCTTKSLLKLDKSIRQHGWVHLKPRIKGFGKIHWNTANRVIDARFWLLQMEPMTLRWSNLQKREYLEKWIICRNANYLSVFVVLYRTAHSRRAPDFIDGADVGFKLRLCS